MWTRPEGARRSGRGRALALAALTLIAGPPEAAWAADPEGEPPGQLRVIRVGDQTLLVDQVGNAILYQDPTPPEQVCAELQACWQIEIGPGASVDIAGGGGETPAFDTEESPAPP